MEFRILGAVEVLDGNRVVPLPRLKQRAVLTLLLLNAGKPIAADRMIEDLWTHPPPAARQALQNNVAQLRKQLGPGLLLTRSGGYVLDVVPDQIDLGRFRVGVEAARAIEEPGQRAALRREALGLWRGEPFPELVSEPFAELERQSLLAERRTAQKDLIDDELRLGRHAEVIAQLESLVVDDRYDERLYAQLMLALYRAGRPTDSLNAFERARRDLDEIGLSAVARSCTPFSAPSSITIRTCSSPARGRTSRPPVGKQ